MTGDFEARRRIQNPVAALPFDLGSELVAVLRDACELEVAELFVDYAAWIQSGLMFRGFAPPTLAEAVDWISANLEAYVPAQNVDIASTVLSKTYEALREVRLAETPEIDEATPAGAIARGFLDHALEGREHAAVGEIFVAIARGMRTVDVYDRILTPVLHETGRLWLRNEIGIAQEHVVSAAVDRAMARLFELAVPQPNRDLSVMSASLGRAAHQIGARMVSDAFAFCGWNAAYLGGNLPVEELLDYVDRVSIDVLALSATLPTDIVPIKQVIAELETRPLAPIVIVGGRAFSVHPSLWQKIGADGYAKTPLGGVTVATELISHSECN